MAGKRVGVARVVGGVMNDIGIGKADADQKEDAQKAADGGDAGALGQRYHRRLAG